MTSVAAPPHPAREPDLGSSPRTSRPVVVFAAAITGVLVASILSVTIGSVTVPLEETLGVLSGRGATDPRWDMVVRELRLPRTITAIAVGAALGIAGLQMQTLFRNALADPFILGASSGASLGVAVVVVIGGGSAGGFTAGLAGLGRAGVVIAAALRGAAISS